MKNLGFKGEISHFSKVFEGNMSKWSLNGWEALNYIFFDQKLKKNVEAFGSAELWTEALIHLRSREGHTWN